MGGRVMPAREILDALRKGGIEVVAEGDRLRFRPRSAVSPELQVAMAEHKFELLRLLETEAASTVCGSVRTPVPLSSPLDSTSALRHGSNVLDSLNSQKKG